MMYFLVYRNEKLETTKIVSFKYRKEAIQSLKENEDSVFELVFCIGNSIRELLKIYPEYRPSNWMELI